MRIHGPGGGQQLSYMQTGVSVSAPSQASEVGQRPDHRPVSFTLDAHKALSDQKTMSALVRMFGENQIPPAPLLARFADKLTDQTMAFLARAFPGMDAESAIDQGMSRLCPDTNRHCLRVGELAARFARELGLDPALRRRLKRAAKAKEFGFLALTLAALSEQEKAEVEEVLLAGGELHDIGKLAVPDEILNKPGPLDDREFELVRLHPVVGEAMLLPLDVPEMLLATVRGHHERWDGAGYPDGLEGLDIPLEARILSLVDTFDAMTELRPYRRRISREQAAREILAEAGGQFDPELAEHFSDMIFDDLEFGD